MRRTRASLLLAASLLPAAWAAGCSSDSSSPPATTSTSTTTTAAARTSFEVATADGQISVSLDGQLPPNWPSSFPLPQGATPAGSGSLGGSSKTGMIAVFTSTQTPDEVYNFYAKDAGLDVGSQSSLGKGDLFVGTVQFSGTPSGRVTVVPKNGKALILISLTTGGAGSTTGSTTGSTGASGSTGSTPGSTVAP